MIGLMENLIEIMKKITVKFEELISDQNKMGEVCQLIQFINSRKYFFECFNHKIFKKYVKLFLIGKKSPETEFNNLLEKLTVENLINQLNEIHLQPAIISIKESI